MVFLQKFRENIGLRLLKKKVKRTFRKKAFNNFDTAKNIGILFNTSVQDDLLQTNLFIQELKDLGKEVSALGVVELEKQISIYEVHDNVKYFATEKTNFCCYPKSANVEHFIAQPFDIMINLSTIEPIAIDYIMANSKAVFKVSKRLRSDEFVDFILDFSQGKNPQTKEIITKIKEYLSALTKA